MSDSVNKYFLLILLSTIFLYSCSSSSYNQRYNKPEKQKEEERDNSVRWTSADDSRESDNKKTEKENTYANPSNETELPEEEYYNDEFLDKFQKLKVLNNTLTDREKVLLEIASYIDTPYEYGGESRRGIDCSAFTQSVYETTLSVELPRSSDQQFLIGETVNNFNNLEFGDLIFFDTTDSKVTGHVGIYIGDGLFAHSSTSKGVNISSLNKDYYKSRFAGGKRVWQFK